MLHLPVANGGGSYKISLAELRYVYASYIFLPRQRRAFGLPSAAGSIRRGIS